MAVIVGTSGADTITPAGISGGVAGGVPGNGDDSITGGGGGGGDFLDGGAGANTGVGGDVDDTIIAFGAQELLYGGDGVDNLIYRGAGNIVVDLGTTTAVDGYLGGATVPGGVDTLVGFESVYAGTGNDTILGSNGDDLL